MNFDRPHRRLNILNGEWVLVSPHRARRPWSGQIEISPAENLPRYDPSCYLCPGNTRANGKFKNPDYRGTFAFDNDFSALLPPDKDLQEPYSDSFFKALPDDGVCRVVCFSPRHDLSIPELELEKVISVVETWAQETEYLAKKEFINYVQIFENKGAMMGCSNPHPHSQIWATRLIPNEASKELKMQRDYFIDHRSSLLQDYLEKEVELNSRIVMRNESFTALVPFWAVWPFETMIISNRKVSSLPELTPSEISNLADIYQQITIRYDNLFKTRFPYTMGFHQKPFDGLDYPEWHFHVHFYPPLLRSATVKKFMVGFEMLAMPQRDITAESAAERLRTLSPLHYRNNH